MIFLILKSIKFIIRRGSGSRTLQVYHSEGLWVPNLASLSFGGLWVPNLASLSFGGVLGPEPCKFIIRRGSGSGTLQVYYSEGLWVPNLANLSFGGALGPEPCKCIIRRGSGSRTLRIYHSEGVLGPEPCKFIIRGGALGPEPCKFIIRSGSGSRILQVYHSGRGSGSRTLRIYHSEGLWVPNLASLSFGRPLGPEPCKFIIRGGALGPEPCKFIIWVGALGPEPCKFIIRRGSPIRLKMLIPFVGKGGWGSGGVGGSEGAGGSGGSVIGLGGLAGGVQAPKGLGKSFRLQAPKSLGDPSSEGFVETLQAPKCLGETLQGPKGLGKPFRLRSVGALNGLKLYLSMPVSHVYMHCIYCIHIHARSVQGSGFGYGSCTLWFFGCVVALAFRALALMALHLSPRASRVSKETKRVLQVWHACERATGSNVAFFCLPWICCMPSWTPESEQ